VGRAHYCPEDAQQELDQTASTVSAYDRAQLRRDKRRSGGSSLFDTIYVEGAIRWASTIVLVEGILGVLLGFILMALVTALRAQGGTPSDFLYVANVLAVVIIATSLLIIILSWALRRGHKWAGEIIVVLLLFNILGEVVSGVSGSIIAIIGIVLSILVLLLIFMGWNDLQ
jgi:hypothetical protein